jgi:RHS repeat-associated protein
VDTPVGKVGIYEQEGVSGTTGNVTQSWTHKDPLGSVIAVSDSAGTLTWCSFDAWGNRRNADDWTESTDPASLAPSATDRGYTGHEQLDNLELVHMNGRIYDPVIAKMISPDPTIPFPDNLQAFNRYSYVMNRPLSLTDPSGFTPKSFSNFKENAQAEIKSIKADVMSSMGLSSKDQIGNGKRTTEYRSETQSFLGSDGMQSYQQNCNKMSSGSRKDDISKKESDTTTEDESSGERTYHQKMSDRYIKMLEDSAWGETSEGKKIIAILKEKNEAGQIRIDFVPGGKTVKKTKFKGRFIPEEGKPAGQGIITMKITLSPSDMADMKKESDKQKKGEHDMTVSGKVDAYAAGLFAHEGYHVLDQQRGTGTQDGYGFDDERAAYDVGYRAATAVFNDLFEGTGREAHNHIKKKWSSTIRAEYKDEFYPKPE